MVTVVDASTFLIELVRGERLDDRDLGAGVGDERTISDLLDTGLYDPDLAAQVSGWNEELAGGHTPEPRSTASVASPTGRHGRFIPADWVRRSSRHKPGQELVFIDVRLDVDGLRRLLDDAVLTEGELRAGPLGWVTYPDALSAWNVDHLH